MPKLKVLPNPFLHVDAKGRPCAIVSYEPTDQNDYMSSKRFVGMTMKHVVAFKAKPNSGQQDMQETWYEPTGEVTELDDSAYYRAALRAGELIAADAFTSKIAGDKKFIEPKERLAAEHVKARLALEDLAHEDHTDEIHRSLAKFDFFANKILSDEKAKQDEIDAKEAKAKADKLKEKPREPKVLSAIAGMKPTEDKKGDAAK